ncbi:MAG: hypothetical protein JWQ02_4177 [Capsulimonas sp.]|jgi:hypothetical protein|nr:hypothetical protein [Capsulimonas sp.]
MLILSIVLGAVLLLLGAVAQRDIRRSIRRLGEQNCSACGMPYGRTVASQARKDYITECEQARRESSGYRIHFAHEWRVECEACSGVGYYAFDTERMESKPSVHRFYP